MRIVIQNNKLRKSEDGGGRTIQDIILAVFYLCLLMTGVIPDTVISVVLLVCVGILFFDKRFYYLLPGLIVYYVYFKVPVVNITVYRTYSLLALLKLIIERRKICITDSVFLLVPILVYTILAITPNNIQMGVFAIVDVVLFYMLYTLELSDEEKKRAFVGAFMVACVFSVATGFLTESDMVLSYKLDGKWRKMDRFLGTFIDPNYCCLMYITALFGGVFMKPLAKWQRIVSNGVLLIGILMTISFTGYVALACVGLFYLFLTGKVRPKYILYMFVAIVLAIGLYTYGTANPDAPVVGDIAYRVNAYIQSFLNSGDESLGVSRLHIYQKTLEAYGNQGLFKQIFGMNVRTPQLNLEGTSVAHNDYADFLYNTGLLLTVVFYGCVIYRLFKYMRRYRANKQPQDGFSATCKVIWLYYAFVLTMLTERQFYLVLFM